MMLAMNECTLRADIAFCKMGVKICGIMVPIAIRGVATIMEHMKAKSMAMQATILPEILPVAKRREICHL